MNKTVKISEFPELYSAFTSMTREDENYYAILRLIEKQTLAKQMKWWAYYDARQAEKVGA